MNLQDLTIKELIESIDENISETKEARKRLVIELNQEKDINRKIIKKELIKRYDENIFRYKIQKLGIEEMIKDHALYAYKKTAQEGQVQEQEIKTSQVGMNDLIKVAEEQIDTLRDIQTSELTDEEVLIKTSVEIRNWCELLVKINPPLQIM